MTLRTKTYTLLLSLLILACGTTICQGSLIHPGDVNNNGIVNGNDLLYLTTVFGNTGPVRINGVNNWQPQVINEVWPDTFQNGLTHAYADCNGDGVVDDSDILSGFVFNFSQTHDFGNMEVDPYALGIPGIDPIIQITPRVTSVEVGTAVRLDVFFNGVDNQDIEDLYGATFILEFPPRFIEDNNPFVFSSSTTSWVGDSDEISAQIITNKDQGLAEMTIARKTKTPISGTGFVGSFSIIIDDVVLGLIDKDTLEIEIINTILIDDELNPRPMVPTTAKIEILARGSSSTQNTFNEQFKVYPNPTSEVFTIEKPNNLTIKEIELLSPLGKKIPLGLERQNDKNISLRLPSKLPVGIYFLQINTNEGVALKQIKIDK